MFIAHLPAGYLCTKAIDFHRPREIQEWSCFLAGLTGAVFPDADGIYFRFFSQRLLRHHEYWTHTPIVWGIAWIAALLLLRYKANKKIQWLSLVFFANVFLHLLLDSVKDGLLWLYPLSGKTFSIAEMTKNVSMPLGIFLEQRIFLLEAAICLAAATVFFAAVYKRHFHETTR